MAYIDEARERRSTKQQGYALQKSRRSSVCTPD